MLRDTKHTPYQEHVSNLDYPEYALRHADDADGVHGLNLSLWNDDLPPGVQEIALRTLPAAVGSYCLTQDKALIQALARKLVVSDDMIVITAGADDALRIASQYCVNSGKRTLIPVPCFGRYVYHAMVNKAKVSYLQFTVYPYEFEIKKIISEIHTTKAECVLLASPNSPTGHALGREAMQQLLDAVSCTVILDEALLLDMPESCSGLVRKYPNLLVCGSFSKLYGLAGMRVGYLIAGREHAARLRKLVSPFEVNSLGIELAKYVIAQDTWLDERISAIKSGIAVLRDVGNPRIKLTHTTAPVALIEYASTSDSLYRLLQDQGVVTVAGKDFPGLEQTNTVRVIIKSMQDMLRLRSILVNIS